MVVEKILELNGTNVDRNIVNGLEYIPTSKLVKITIISDQKLTPISCAFVFTTGM